MEIPSKEKMIAFLARRNIRIGTAICVALGLLAVLLTIWFPPLVALRIAFGSGWVLFIPGWLLTLVFFPKTQSIGDNANADTSGQSLDSLERSTLACLLSIIVVPTALFVAHRLGVVLTHINVTIVIGVVTLGCALAAWWKLRARPED